MTLTVEHGLVALAGSLLSSAAIYAWKGGGLARGVEKALEYQGELLKELREKVEALDKIPSIEVRLGHLERNHSLIPKLQGELEKVKAEQRFSGERARLMLRSRPDSEE